MENVSSISSGVANKSTLKAIRVLGCFSPEKPLLSAREIAKLARLPVSTTHRILAALVHGELLEKDKESLEYCPSVKLYSIGMLYLMKTDLISVSSPILRKINELTGEIVNVSVLSGRNASIILREEAKNTPRFTVGVGSVFPAHSCAIGKSLLSELSDDQIDTLYPEDTLLKLTPHTIGSKSELKEELDKIRKSGVAINSEENFLGVKSYASIIRNCTGEAIAALSISLWVYKWTEEYGLSLSELVRLGAGLASKQLGYRCSEDSMSNLEELASWWNKNKLSGF